MSEIEFKNVCKSYDQQAVLQNFDLSIEKGEFVSIVGPSGCGKTTILRLINGLLRPDSGTIWVRNENIDTKDLVQLRQTIGYAIQGSVLFPHMNVEENIAYVPSLSHKRKPSLYKDSVDQWMKITGLSLDLKQRYPDELSGGQQQRVGIARALAASPNILLMDEPFGAVDVITRRQLQDEILRIHQQTKITIVFVTHDIEEALKLSTKVLILNQGKIQQYESQKTILQHPANEFVQELIGQHKEKL